MQRNPPDKRLAFIVKTYLDKQPWVVWDTISVIFNTIGIDQPAKLMADAALDGVETPAGMTPRSFASDLKDMFRAGTMLPGLPDPNWDHRPLPQVDPQNEDAERWRTHRYSSLLFDSRMYWKEPIDGRWRTLTDAIPLVTSNTFADGLMNEPHKADGVFLWVARELSKLSKHVIVAMDKEGSTDFRNREEYELYTEALDTLRRRTNAIAAWAQKNRIDLNKLSLAEALEGSKDFKSKVAVPQGIVVKRFKSGWTIQELRGRGRLDPEGERLQHCVGSYCSRVESGLSQIYSLRDPDGVPYVTMEVDPDSSHFVQVFGEKNSSVGSKEFGSYVFNEGQANEPPLRESDVSVVVEAIQQMLEEFIDERSGGHLGSLALANINLTPRVQAAVRAAPAGADLSGLRLPRIDLSGLDLTKTILDNTALREANLRGANLTHGTIVSARLDGADLEGADLVGAQAGNTVFNGSNLTGANMAAIKAADAQFSRAIMQSANLRFAYLWKANFADADLSGADLRDTDVRHANFMGADLRGADLRGMKIGEGHGQFRGAKYDGRTLFWDGCSPRLEYMVRDDSPMTEEGRERAGWEAAGDRDAELYQDDEEYDPYGGRGEDDEDDDEDEDDDDW
jgi:uncharacterized protein YjbI with pentapeptide repeats